MDQHLVTALVGDLFFQVKIEAILAAAGYPVSFLQPGDAPGGDLLVVDLTADRADVARAVEAARKAAVPVIAFGAHADREGLDWARQAGCVEVIPKGAVERALPSLVAKHLSRATGTA